MATWTNAHQETWAWKWKTITVDYLYIPMLFVAVNILLSSTKKCNNHNQQFNMLLKW